MPEKSGTPSAVRGAGAVRLGRPSALRGAPFVGYDGHCATSAGANTTTNRKTPSDAIADLTAR
jgi:hypothetical protein